MDNMIITNFFNSSTSGEMPCNFSAGDNFCRVCRTNLRNVIRGRGGLYQQLHRAPSPLRNSSPPRPEPSEAGDESSSGDEEEGEHGVVEGGDAGNQGPANNNGGGGGGEGGRNRAVAAGQGGGGFLRVVAIDDGECTLLLLLFSRDTSIQKSEII